MTSRAVSPPKGSYRWLVLAAATLAQATASFAMLGVAALAGFLQQDFKLTAAETGLLITATYGAAVFSLLFVGDLLDRKSERIIIGVGGAIAFIALMMATRSSNFVALLLCLFVAGLESVRKHQAGLQSFRSMRRIDARRKNASALRLRFSQSLASLRHRLSQAMVRSTTQRRGNTTNPLA